MEAHLESREQSVSLLELFYDLVYVYAISQVTGILNSPDYSPTVMIDYLVATFIVLQAWMYMTNYINRFGRTVRTNAVLTINMCASIVMSTAIAGSWASDLTRINRALFVMLGSVAVLYASRLRDNKSAREMAIYSLKTLVPVCIVYLVVGIAAERLHPTLVLALDLCAIAWGIFGPAIIAPRYTLDLSLISFPHLVERFELITIVTFGEAVVTVAQVFHLVGLGLWSVATFLDVAAMFGCYVVLMHNLCDHQRQHRGLRLIYCHFFVVIAVNLFTVSLNLLAGSGATRPRICVLAAIALALFFLCLALLAYYRRKEVVFSSAQKNALLFLVCVGIAITLSGTPGGITVFLAGPLVAAGGCFAILRRIDLSLEASDEG